MEAGAEVWIKDIQGREAWIPAVVISKEPLSDGSFDLLIQTESGESKNYKLAKDEEDSPELKLRNIATDSIQENLINLPYLHEPAILFCLQERYKEDIIYTYTGPILIAVNPFKRLLLYSEEILEKYYETGLLKSQGIEGHALSPHVYSIADVAYRQMMNVIMKNVFMEKNSSFNSFHSPTKNGEPANQSILISGESGAGKTESTKIVLKYLTTVGKDLNKKSNPKSDSSSSSCNSPLESSVNDDNIMSKILQSNPILEAFGNAKTLRNENSSRFGKFIELNFNNNGRLIGGNIRTYLLEKVRLPFQQKGERNFHIFYQLFSGCSDEEKRNWRMKPSSSPNSSNSSSASLSPISSISSNSSQSDSPQSPSLILSSNIEDYEYLCRGECFKTRTINDKEDFDILKQAFNILKFSSKEQNLLFDILIGIIYIGNLSFESFSDGEGEGSKIKENENNRELLSNISSLLGISSEDLTTTLLTRLINVNGENFIKKLTSNQARDAADALSKSIYGKLFNWIVKKINQSIEVSSNLVKANIGVLDIFGFESFLINSFEQLCINYTNEKLQQQFNQYIFKIEQEEYEREKIIWTFIEFPDNKECLELIEHKTFGIFSMIDDECKLPKASDERLANKMYKSLEKNKKFSVTNAQKSLAKFSIVHYAGLVEYSTENFIEKNKDELPKEAINLLNKSTNSLLLKIFSIQDDNSNNPTSSSSSSNSSSGNKDTKKNNFSSVSSQFKDQLTSLMDYIYSTSPHYIRCLKSNDQNEPDNFDKLRITEQLRYGGVLEAVRVARSGFPVRLSHYDFYEKYRCILTSQSIKIMPYSLKKSKTDDVKILCEELIQQIWIQIYQKEENEEEKENELKPKNRKFFYYQNTKEIPFESIQIGLTKTFLRKQAHDLLELYRYQRLSFFTIKIQSIFRTYLCKISYFTIKNVARLIQRIYRGHVGRVIARRRREEKACILLQTTLRMFLKREKYKNIREKIIIIQRNYRRIRRIREEKRRKKEKSERIIYKCIVQNYYRNCYTRFRSAVIILQNCYRIKIAKRLRKKLREEARSMKKLEENNQKLREEIEFLKKNSIKGQEIGNISLRINEIYIKIKEEKEKIIEVEEKIKEEEKRNNYDLENEDDRTDEEDNEKKLEEISKSIDNKNKIMRKYEGEIRELKEKIKKLEQQIISFNEKNKILDFSNPSNSENMTVSVPYSLVDMSTSTEDLLQFSSNISSLIPIDSTTPSPTFQNSASSSTSLSPLTSASSSSASSTILPPNNSLSTTSSLSSTEQLIISARIIEPIIVNKDHKTFADSACSPLPSSSPLISSKFTTDRKTQARSTTDSSSSTSSTSKTSSKNLLREKDLKIEILENQIVNFRSRVGELQNSIECLQARILEVEHSREKERSLANYEEKYDDQYDEIRRREKKREEIILGKRGKDLDIGDHNDINEEDEENYDELLSNSILTTIDQYKTSLTSSIKGILVEDTDNSHQNLTILITFNEKKNELTFKNLSTNTFTNRFFSFNLKREKEISSLCISNIDEIIEENTSFFFSLTNSNSSSSSRTRPLSSNFASSVSTIYSSPSSFIIQAQERKMKIEIPNEEERESFLNKLRVLILVEKYEESRRNKDELLNKIYDTSVISNTKLPLHRIMLDEYRIGMDNNEEMKRYSAPYHEIISTNSNKEIKKLLKIEQKIKQKNCKNMIELLIKNEMKNEEIKRKEDDRKRERKKEEEEKKKYEEEKKINKQLLSKVNELTIAVYNAIHEKEDALEQVEYLQMKLRAVLHGKGL